MNLIERYMFRRMATFTVTSFLALATMLWLSQALREFNLVTDQGQSLATFFELSAYLLPILIMIILPLSVMIGVTFTLTMLNSGSELAVIDASGMSQWSLLKPTLLIGLFATVMIAAMSLYYTPLTLRLGQEMLTEVRSSLISSIAREGDFTTLADGLTFHLASRENDGTLRGIFVSDTRDSDKTMTYIAQKGAIIDNPLGTFLVMSNGSIQQKGKTDDTISIIEFSSYAFDLSTFTSAGPTAALTPQQQPTEYLLHPDPNDQYFRQSPGDFITELTDRITAPLYGLVFAVVPLLFLGQAQSHRISRAPSVAMASIVLILIRVVAFLMLHVAPGSAPSLTIMYTVPIGSVALSVFLVMRGVQIRPSERLLAAIDATLARASGLIRRRAAAPAGT